MVLSFFHLVINHSSAYTVVFQSPKKLRKHKNPAVELKILLPKGPSIRYVVLVGGMGVKHCRFWDNIVYFDGPLVFLTKDVKKMKINFGQNNKIMHHSHLKYSVPEQKLLLDFFNHNWAIWKLEFPNEILNLGSLCFIASHDRSFARAQTH